MEELISVIVPIYKVEKYLKKCINSIINQTYQNLEIILVDDGSPDNCGKICDEYAQKDKRITVIHKENGGQSEARNLALDIAKGKYIAFVDSDDYIKEDMIEILCKNMLEYNADISICNIIKVKEKRNENIEKYGEIEIYNSSDSIKQLLKQHITNYLPNKLYKKEIWNDIRLPKGKILEDMDVMYKLLEKTNKIVATNKTEYYYVIRKDSSISQVNVKVTKDLKDAVNKRYIYLSKQMPEVLDLLILTRLQNIMQYHHNLAYCKEKKTYKSEEFTAEYQFFKEKFNDYKKKLFENQSIKNKIELYLLYSNKKIYYYYVRTKFKIKKIIKR